MPESLRFVVEGPFRTSGAAVAQQWVGQEVGVTEVQLTQEKMREAFSTGLENGERLREWLLEGCPLALEADFSLFGQRAEQTDLDNLLAELFDQMLKALFPEESVHERSKKDRFFFDAHIRKTKVFERTEERSVIIVRPLSGSE